MASQSSQQSLWWEYQVLLYLLITDKKTEVGRIQWASQVIPLKNGEGGLLPFSVAKTFTFYSSAAKTEQLVDCPKLYSFNNAVIWLLK